MHIRRGKTCRPWRPAGAIQIDTGLDNLRDTQRAGRPPLRENHLPLVRRRLRGKTQFNRYS